VAYPLPNPIVELDPESIQRNFDELARLVPTTTTTLPASARDDQVIYVPVDLTKGIVWQFRYRFGSGSAYKWEFIGGPPLFAEVAADETTASTAYAALTTAGPSLTVPFGGDYRVEIGCETYTTAGLAGQALMSYDIGATGAVDADAITQGWAANTNTFSGARARAKTGLAANTALVAKYRVTASTGHFNNRWMRVTPVRIG
jgi:hypothetical protein